MTLPWSPLGEFAFSLVRWQLEGPPQRALLNMAARRSDHHPSGSPTTWSFVWAGGVCVVPKTDLMTPQ
jgi:hypothetical protein